MIREREAPRETDSAPLLEGIAREAEAAISALEAEAKTLAEARRTGAAAQAAAMEAAALAELESRRSSILRIARSRLAVERGKRSLRAREIVERDMLDAAERACYEAAKDPRYGDRVRDWLVEAALALSVESALVRVSSSERALMSPDLLRKAEAEVLELGGKPVRLSLAPGEPLAVQGLRLESEDGRLAYDNGIPARAQRARGELLRMIDAAFFEAAPAVSGARASDRIIT